MPRAKVYPTTGNPSGYMLVPVDICATDRSWVLTDEQKEDLTRLYEEYMSRNQEDIHKRQYVKPYGFSVKMPPRCEDDI